VDVLAKKQVKNSKRRTHSRRAKALMSELSKPLIRQRHTDTNKSLGNDICAEDRD
jgi:hypothetical protein